jgi:hypothetical protein
LSAEASKNGLSFGNSSQFCQPTFVNLLRAASTDVEPAGYGSAISNAGALKHGSA